VFNIHYLTDYRAANIYSLPAEGTMNDKWI